MARQKSPFASMTQREQLEKWMEFQSIQLPFSEGSVDTDYAEEIKTPAQDRANERLPKDAATADNFHQGFRAASATPSQTRPSAVPSEPQQKPRHRQYDAVIERMKLASQKAATFQRTN